jgi:hypothetical protein
MLDGISMDIIHCLETIAPSHNCIYSMLSQMGCTSLTKIESYILAIKIHGSSQTKDVSKERQGNIVIRWTLSYFSKVLCLFMATPRERQIAWDTTYISSVYL